jgi:hypothetical protein
VGKVDTHIVSEIKIGDVTIGDLSQEIENKGLLVHKKGVGQLEFRFVYLGFPFAVRAEAGTKGSSIDIRSILGYLPYSSESLRDRQGAMKVLAAASGALGRRVRFGKGQRLEMSDRRTSKDPLTPVNLVSLMTSIMLEAKPFLDLLSGFLKSAPENETLLDGAAINDDALA